MTVIYADNGNVAIFNSMTFRRDKRTGYYLSSKAINGKRKRLHVAVWEHYNGEIPVGYHVHHKLHDKSKNDIQDLELLESLKHRKLHGYALTEEQREFRRKNVVEKANPKASEWHRSEAGRLWHSEQSKKTWENRSREYQARPRGDKRYTFLCTYCGNKFESKNQYSENQNSFCSNNCKSAYRRKMRIDDIDRNCATCGKIFTANKYSSVKYCSAECRKNKTH